MPDSFGARLRRRREEQQIELTTIADRTKIKVSLLEGLERDDVTRWPSGIFRRAFIRGYAKAIGLDPDEIVREFQEVHPDPGDEPALPATWPDDGTQPAGGPPMRLRYLAGSALNQLFKGRGKSEPTTILPSPPIEPREAAIPEIEPLVSVVGPIEDAGPPAGTVGMPIEASAREPLFDVTSAGLPELEAAPSELLPAPEPDLAAAADLCTELARVHEAEETAPLLEKVARILDAVGLIVWVWDSNATQLKPVAAHGYSERVLAQLPKLARDTKNATAAAFRSARTCVVSGSDVESGALAVPLITPAGCGGVLAIELQRRGEQKQPVRALATIFAAQLAASIRTMQFADAADRRLA